MGKGSEHFEKIPPKSAFLLDPAPEFSYATIRLRGGVRLPPELIFTRHDAYQQER